MTQVPVFSTSDFDTEVTKFCIHLVMANLDCEFSSDSKDNSSADLDLNFIGIWNLKREKCQTTENFTTRNGIQIASSGSSTENSCGREEIRKKFDDLKKRSKEIQVKSRLRQEKTEKRKSERLIRKATKDPDIRKFLKDSDKGAIADSADKEEWQDIKPYLTINDHLHGLISHGSCGPKTELENMVDMAIEEGDLEKAEMLSDNLANREFAVKIAHAFEAKRCAEKLAEEEAIRKAKRLKKLPWGFEAKERWQMKGNM